MAVTEAIREQIKREWSEAPCGTKTHVIRGWARTLGLSYQTVYRMVEAGRRRCKGDYRIEGIAAAAMVVAQIKRRPPKDAGEIPTDQAIQLAIDNNLIPKELEGVSVATFNRVMRENGLTQRVKRVQRYQAEYPNQLHHVDASSSNYFYVWKQDGGDCILRLHGGSARGYKNKPVPTRLRPWLYGLTDDYSGYHVARYIAAVGENLNDNLDFLAWAWARNLEKPFFGIPERIKADQGPLMKGDVARDWLDRLGVLADPSLPYEKDAHGKVERPWRTLWGRFEKAFFVESDWKHFEITLSELNRRFRIYQQEYNDRPHRYEREISRIDAWRRIGARGGAVAIPENAIQTAARRYERTVGADGCVHLDGRIYEVKGLHAAKVRVYEGVFEDKIVVEDMATGEKYEAVAFAPTPLDTFRAHKETLDQKARKAAETLEIRNTLYMRPQAEETGNVRRFPTRIKEERAMENPLAADAYASVEAAMRDFTSICGALDDEEMRQEVRDMIVNNGLSKAYTRELALEIQAELSGESPEEDQGV